MKFTAEQKNEVKQAIETSGEQLFLKYGLQKVTIDDIVNGVRIGKGTFYVFFANKFDLFLEISKRRQEKIFDQITDLPISPNKQVLQEVLLKAIKLFSTDDFLKMLDAPTKELLQQKSSDKFIEIHNAFDQTVLTKLNEFGLKPLVPNDVMIELMNVIFIYGIEVFSTQKDDRALRQLIDLVVSNELKGLSDE
ncbi:TetR/AcrR family transcriptional regulator [Xylocopilactobacillus apicola]|uniref:TetR family transcriptional regulator n=1 Tax=Xylocopilactobacillus apicola TaxID=2932184 RepID=A0AAU9CYN5_9LACO|nr:TetR/AcrR family transcriptional regulator [Xylocopilactobacillus apicola]BDR59129.1 TetR family transcriptional regulator [Xylocopilactobacillus apicola]